MLKNKHVKNKKVLITGGGGFIGGHLFNYLKKNLKYDILQLKNKNFNLSALNNFKNILLKYQPNYIIHLAARTKPTIKTKKEDKLQYQNTTLPIINLIKSIKYCRNLEKIIFFGTIEEYGLAKVPFSENDKPKPTSSYGIAKINGLNYVKKKIKNNLRLKYVWIRPSLVFGKKDNKERFLATLYNCVKYKKKIKVNINSQIRDFLFIDDLCRIIKLLIIKKLKVKNNILNITAENWINMNTIFSYFPKKIQNKFDKLVVISNKKKHLDYYSSGKVLRKNFINFKFTSFKKALSFTFGYKI